MNEKIDNLSGIYAIEAQDGRRYVGSAICFRVRWNRHKMSLRRGNHHSVILQRCWNKYGEHFFKFKILLVCEKDQLISWEQSFIDELKPEFNVCKKAGSSIGFKHSAETRMKLAAISAVVQKGRKHSIESRIKRSIALKGRKPSPQTIAATVAVCTGKKLTAEHKAKIGFAARNISDETRSKIAESSRKRRHTAESKAKIAQSNRTRWIKGQLTLDLL